MARELGLVKTTVYGLVSTLENNGFLQKDIKTRRYRLGFALFELSSIQMDGLEINQRAGVPLQKLSDNVNRLCHVAIWDRDSIILTMVAQPHGQKSMGRQIGPRLPGYSTGLGKAILANMSESEQKEYLDNTELVAFTPKTITDKKAFVKELNQIRIQGYSISRNETLPNQSGVAAAVFKSDGQIAGAISVRLNNKDLDTTLMSEAIELLIETAADISSDMGYRPLEAKFGF